MINRESAFISKTFHKYHSYISYLQINLADNLILLHLHGGQWHQESLDFDLFLFSRKLNYLFFKGC